MSDTPWDQVVWKLVRQTESGELKWEPGGKVPEPAGDRQVSPSFVTTVEGRLIRIYQYESAFWPDEDTSYPDRDVAIEFVDAEGGTLWSFPKTEARIKLWNLVQYKAIDADQFLERYLKAS